MKEHLSIAERNRIVETHLGRIDSVMQSKRSIIRSIRMERDDIYQQLAVRLILAVAGFDNSDASSIEAYIDAQLHSELNRCQRIARLQGMCDVAAQAAGGCAVEAVYA